MKKTWQVACLVGAFTLILFAPNFRNGFVLFDDDLHVFRNPKLLYEPEPVKFFWSQGYKGFYIPMTYTVWSGLLKFSTTNETEKRWPKLKPLPFHAANILLHAANTVILFLLLKLFCA